jgi:hypothetical protein
MQTEIKASDRTYIRDARGTMRVADYNANGVENSDVYVPFGWDSTETPAPVSSPEPRQ